MESEGMYNFSGVDNDILRKALMDSQCMSEGHTKNIEAETSKAKQNMSTENISCKSEPDSDYDPAVEDMFIKVEPPEEFNSNSEELHSNSEDGTLIPDSWLHLKMTEMLSRQELNLTPDIPPYTKIKILPGENSFDCNLCPYKTKFQTNMRRHQMTHDGLKPYACSQCNYVCASSSGLKRHMYKHTGFKGYSCNECDFTTSLGESLKRHMYTHTGVKPFGCTECSYRCTNAHSLKRHILTHTQERPFVCDQCPLSYSSAGALKTHKLVHNQQHTFACELCSYATSQVRSMKRHIAAHSREKMKKSSEKCKESEKPVNCKVESQMVEETQLT